MLSLLLDAGANGTAVDEQLLIAVQSHHSEAVRLLRARGASLDRNNGALTDAIKHNQVETLRLLLDGPISTESLANALPHVRWASKQNHSRISRMLLDTGAGEPSLSVALRDAVCDEERDDELIDTPSRCRR